MDRLTVRGTKEAKSSATIKEVTDKLAGYEDADEDGLLVKLPCKVGDLVYVIGVLGSMEVETYTVRSVTYRSELGDGADEIYMVAVLRGSSDDIIGFRADEVGKTVFLSEYDAQVASLCWEDEEDGEAD